jgi:tRNA threonylcarbamoyl adenosine modification protein (Sua5/YciO/YrdC/YwlC family)
MAMLLRIYNENPNHKHIRQVVELLEEGGIIIYPTDTIYAMGCDIRATRSVEKIARFKGLNPKNPELSLIFHDMSQLSEYTIIRDNNIFKLLKRNLPGPFRYQNYSKTRRRWLVSEFRIIILFWNS